MTLYELFCLLVVGSLGIAGIMSLAAVLMFLLELFRDLFD